MNGRREHPQKGIEERQHRKERWKDDEIRKGFTREPQRDEPATPVKNYITRGGLERPKR